MGVLKNKVEVQERLADAFEKLITALEEGGKATLKDFEIEFEDDTAKVHLVITQLSLKITKK